jgi:hypothetical protein
MELLEKIQLKSKGMLQNNLFDRPKKRHTTASKWPRVFAWRGACRHNEQSTSRKTTTSSAYNKEVLPTLNQAEPSSKAVPPIDFPKTVAERPHTSQHVSQYKGDTEAVDGELRDELVVDCSGRKLDEGVCCAPNMLPVNQIRGHVEQVQELMKEKGKLQQNLSRIDGECDDLAAAMSVTEKQLSDLLWQDVFSLGDPAMVAALCQQLVVLKERRMLKLEERRMADQKFHTECAQFDESFELLLARIREVASEADECAKSRTYRGDGGEFGREDHQGKSCKNQSLPRGEIAADYAHNVVEPSENAMQADHISNTEESKRQESLIYQFRHGRAWVCAQQKKLEDIHEDIEFAAAQRDELILENKNEESQSEFDIRMLQLGQEYTRDVIEAEEDYERARGALIAAGLQIPRTDIESGFLDHPDDGYRLSEEIAMIAAPSPQAIQGWLASITGGSDPTGTPHCDDDRDDLGLEDWDLNSVDVCDSLSMKAEGKSRRRIDEWRKLAEGVRCRLAGGV